jgi:two-component system cell cycle sensor histidine kinase/response regulator CckA
MSNPPRSLPMEMDIYQQMVECSPSGMVLVDSDGRIVRVNHTLETSFGYTRQELLGQPVEILLPERIRASHIDMRRMFMNGPDARPMGSGRDLFGARKDGSEFPVEVGLNPMPGPDGMFILAVIVDISQRKAMESEHARLQTKLQQAQRMESLGVMAGGVAHDFNNLLTGVIGNTDLAMMSLAPHSPVCSNLKEIQRSALKAADLCRQMLAYSGKGRFIIEPVDLNHVIEDVTHQLRTSLPRSVTLRRYLHHRLPRFTADPNQIEQVVSNLILNAAEAITGPDGCITVRTGQLEADTTYLDSLQLNDSMMPGSFIHLDIEDNGIGMDRVTQERIFEPFFTTKFAGRGLGLAGVAGILRGHGGGIRVQSEQGKGTRIRVLFPWDGIETPGEYPVVELADGWRGFGRILVIEDEPVVRDVIRRTLAGLGFDMVLCPNGKDGLARFNERPTEWCLVLLDFTLPDIGGQEIFHHIHATRPDLPVLIMSGYDGKEISHLFRDQGISGCLQKPLRPGELVTAVQQAVSTKAPWLAASGKPHAEYRGETTV